MIIADFIMEWLFLILGVVAIIPAFIFNSRKYYGTSTFFMFVSAGSLGWFYWPEISQMVLDFGIVKTGIYLSALYIIGAIATSFVYWIFYNFKAKERFEYYFERASIPDWVKNLGETFTTSYRRYSVIEDSTQCRHIFDDPDAELNIRLEKVRFDRDELQDGDSIQAVIDKFDAQVNEILPPRFKVCKYFIIGAGLAWPITVVWLVLARVVKQLVERIISSFGSTFDGISRYAFGKF